MDIATLTSRVARRMDAQRAAFYQLSDHMSLFRRREPTEFSAALYEPVVCLVLQGGKQLLFDDIVVEVRPGHTLVVSHDVPVRARIVDASPQRPYLSIVLSLRLALLRSLYDEIGAVALEDLDVSSLAVHQADARLTDCLGRYLEMIDDPLEARILTEQLEREIHFRLLMAPHGGMLRALLRHDSHASHIAQAISRIRRDFRTALTVTELAREVGMSTSSFHKHFREITSSTPLQYQKELRLLEAKRLLAGGQHNVTTVALEVGYSSPNQFSREYSRKFGVPPSVHMASP